MRIPWFVLKASVGRCARGRDDGLGVEVGDGAGAGVALANCARPFEKQLGGQRGPGAGCRVTDEAEDE